MELHFAPGKYPLIFTRKDTTYQKEVPQQNESTNITGVFPGHVWEVGDTIVSTHPMCPGIFVVTEVKEQRDARGIYENDEHINSFFHLALHSYVPEIV